MLPLGLVLLFVQFMLTCITTNDVTNFMLTCITTNDVIDFMLPCITTNDVVHQSKKENAAEATPVDEDATTRSS